MKSLLYTLYVVSILTFSATARASLTFPFGNDATSTSLQRAVPIYIVTPDYQHLNLTLEGKLQNLCYGSPIATLEQDPKDANVLVLKLLSSVPIDRACAMALKDYKTTVNLPALAKASSLSLDNKAMYTIKTSGFDFEIDVPGSDLLR